MRVSKLILPLTLAATLAPVAIAHGAQTFGSTLPDPANTAPTCALPCEAILSASAEAAPVGGDLVSWRIRSDSSATVQPGLFRPAVGGWTFLAYGPPVTISAGTRTVDGLRVPIERGDRLGFRVSSGAIPEAFATGGERTLRENGVEHTETGEPTVQGVIEPEGDLSIAAAGPAFTTVDSETPFTFTVRNAGPSSAPQVVVTDQVPAGTRAVRADAAGTPCTIAATIRCELGTLARDGARAVTVVLAPMQADVAFAHGARVTGDGLDLATANDKATVQTFVTAPSIAPPPSIELLRPCVNVRRGTDDDELLGGTAFGDRLVGLGGRDLIRGGDGPDCLEGGAGADVLNGEGGDDRLSGADGRDRLSGGTGNDRLVGGRKADALYGNAGNDQLFPSSGRDRVLGGAGDDVISARDGSRDTIECGPGSDRVSADRIDRLRGCERAARR